MRLLFGNSDAQKKVSPLWKGINIYDQLQQSSWGKFREFITGCSVQENFQTLPRIVVIGAESAGKSCLIENVSKVAIFPRNHTTCTKYPVRLIINPERNDDMVTITFRSHSIQVKKTEVLSHLSKLMKSAPTITDEEVTVTVYKQDFPAFEMIDLPGIREYPIEEREQTRNLVLKYISDPDTLVLCVVPAITPRITANQAIGLVMERGKMDKTIICLTMCDKLQPYEVEEKLMKRILQQTDELPSGWAGVVAVINREHTDTETLEDVNQKEYNEFVELLEHMPKRYVEHRKTIEESVTITQVIRHLDQLFHRHICDHWKPKAIQTLSEEICRHNKYLEALGPDPSEINIEDIAGIVKKYLKDQTVSGHLLTNEKICPADKFSTWKGISWNATEDFEDIIEGMRATPTKVKDVVTDALFDTITKAIDDCYRFGQGHPYQYHRFQNLQTSQKVALVCIHDTACDTMIRHIDKLYDDIRPDTLKYDFKNIDNIYERITAITRSAGYKIVREFEKSDYTADSVTLCQECEEFSTQRKALQFKISDLKHRKHAIEHLNTSVES